MGELIYFVDGKYVNASNATLPVGDLAIVRGYGVFDYLRTYDHVPFMLREHVKRLEYSADQIGLALPYTLDKIELIVHETNQKNGLANVGIRIVVTGGESASFMMPENKPTLSVLIHPIAPPPIEAIPQGASVLTTDVPRLMPTVKSLNYLGAILAMREAEKEGAIEAVYRTASGHVTEATRSNLFLVRNGKLVTPKEGILFGITRQAVLEAVQGTYEVEERDIPYEELLHADEVFITSSTKEIVPITKVDGQLIGDGRAGEHTLDILELFHQYVRKRIGSLP